MASLRRIPKEIQDLTWTYADGETGQVIRLQLEKHVLAFNGMWCTIMYLYQRLQIPVTQGCRGEPYYTPPEVCIVRYRKGVRSRRADTLDQPARWRIYCKFRLGYRNFGEAGDLLLEWHDRLEAYDPKDERAQKSPRQRRRPRVKRTNGQPIAVPKMTDAQIDARRTAGRKRKRDYDERKRRRKQFDEELQRELRAATSPPFFGLPLPPSAEQPITASD